MQCTMQAKQWGSDDGMCGPVNGVTLKLALWQLLDA